MDLLLSIFVDTWRDFDFLIYYLPLLLLAPYLLGPVFVKLTQKMPRQPHFDQVDFAGSQDLMPQAALDFFAKSHESLTKQGFRARAFLLQTGQVPGVSVAVRLYEESKALDYGVALLVLAKVPGLAQEVHQSVIEFSTRLETGETIDTTNRDNADPFPQPESKDVFRCPILEDPGDLYQVHRARLDGRRLTEKTRIEEGEEAEAISKSMAEEVEWAARLGYFSLSGENYVPTWKGALLMTWRELWPLKQLQQKKFESEAKAFVEGLGLSGKTRP